MSAALRLTTQSPPTESAGPDPRKWVAIGDAAELLGRDAGALRRECRDKLERIGMATKATPPDGGAAAWFVSRQYDDKLMAGVAGEKRRTPSLDPYTRRQQDDAFARAACVESYREARAHWSGPQKEWMPRLVKQLQREHPGLKISEKSLRRWYKDYQSPGDLENLIDQRGGNRRGEADPACWSFFKDLYLDENRRSVSACWRKTEAYARREGLRWVTLGACRYQLEDRIPPEEQARFRNPKRWRDEFQPHAEWKPDQWEAGERWDGDHCVLDLMCWWGEGSQRKMIRPWLTAWMDWRTRRIVGWHLSDGPNAQTILSAFRVAMLDEANHGGPGIVYIDNGKDYDSYVFHGMTKAERQQAQRDRKIKRELNRLGKIEGGMRVDEGRAKSGVFNLLGIEAHFSLPYNPTGKSRLERWFGTMHDSFDKEWDTYCGPTTDKKPESLEKVLKQQPHKVPTFETVKAELEAFIAEYNATPAMRTGAEGYSPDQAMVALPYTRRPSADPIALRECMSMWHRPVKVGRNGVRITLGTVSYSYGKHQPELNRLKRTGKVVHVRYDPEDMSRVEIYEENMRHLCTATENNRAGAVDGKLKHKDMKELMSARRKRKKRRDEDRKHELVDLMPAEYALGMVKQEAITLPTVEPKVEPRDVKLSGKPQQRRSTDLAELVRQGGGLGDIDARLKAKQQHGKDDQAEADEGDFDLLNELREVEDPMAFWNMIRNPELATDDDDIDLASLNFGGGAA